MKKLAEARSAQRALRRGESDERWEKNGGDTRFFLAMAVRGPYSETDFVSGEKLFSPQQRRDRNVAGEVR
jgi:hypothetical protein